MSPLSETSLIVASIFIVIAGIFMLWPCISPIFVSIAIFMVKLIVCLSPGLGCRRSTLRGSAPASSSLTCVVEAGVADVTPAWASGAFVPRSAPEAGLRFLRQSGHLLHHIIQPVRNQFNIITRVLLLKAPQRGVRLLVFGLRQVGLALRVQIVRLLNETVDLQVLVVPHIRARRRACPQQQRQDEQPVKATLDWRAVPG